MLPTYSKQYDTEDATVDTASDPLLGHFEGRTSTETAPPVYPPSSSSAPPPSTEGRHNVVYKYKPVFPREGDEQYAVGVLGRSRAETIDIVQRGIPGLAEFDSSRISFQQEVPGHPSSHWAIILDEAWDHFGDSPPSTLKVVVADEPGDKELRSKHNTEMCLCITAFLGVIGLMVFGILYLANRMSSRKRPM